MVKTKVTVLTKEGEREADEALLVVQKMSKKEKERFLIFMEGVKFGMANMIIDREAEDNGE